MTTEERVYPHLPRTEIFTENELVKRNESLQVMISEERIKFMKEKQKEFEIIIERYKKKEKNWTNADTSVKVVSGVLTVVGTVLASVFSAGSFVVASGTVSAILAASSAGTSALGMSISIPIT